MNRNVVVYAHIFAFGHIIIYEEGTLRYRNVIPSIKEPSYTGKSAECTAEKVKRLTNEEILAVERFFASINFRLMKSDFDLSCRGTIYDTFSCESSNGKTFKVVYINPSYEFTRIYNFLSSYCEFEPSLVSSNDIDKSIISDPTAWLIRESTNKKIPIVGDIFSIGRSMDSNCFLWLNMTVEREHAKIVLKNNEYYLVNVSRGKTYVDECIVATNQKRLLSANSRISLGNETFYFFRKD